MAHGSTGRLRPAYRRYSFHEPRERGLEVTIHPCLWRVRCSGETSVEGCSADPQSGGNLGDGPPLLPQVYGCSAGERALGAAPDAALFAVACSPAWLRSGQQSTSNSARTPSRGDEPAVGGRGHPGVADEHDPGVLKPVDTLRGFGHESRTRRFLTRFRTSRKRSFMRRPAALRHPG